MSGLKTTLLLGALTGLFLAVGYYVGGQEGAMYAFLLAVVINFSSYWFSDKIVMSMYGAKQLAPTDNPKLFHMVEELAREGNLPMPKVYQVDMDIANAFATGRNKNHASIAVTSGILHLLTEAELRGVLAHELSHVKNNDILISTVAATIAGAISLVAQIAYFTGGLNNRDREGNGGGIATLLLVLLTPIIATLLHLAVSRSREYGADSTGAELSKDPESLASALLKISGYTSQHALAPEPKYEATAHLFFSNPFHPSMMMSLFSTHPPVEERVRRLRQGK